MPAIDASFILALVIAVVQAAVVIDRWRWKQKQKELEQAQQLTSRQPLAARVHLLEQAMEHERKEWSKKQSELTAHLLNVDLAIKVLQTNEMSTFKDIKRIEDDIQRLQDRRR